MTIAIATSVTSEQSDLSRRHRELRNDELEAVTGGSSAISNVLKGFGEALQNMARGDSGPIATTVGASARGTGGQIGP
jgi:hypothetical protein